MVWGSHSVGTTGNSISWSIGGFANTKHVLSRRLLPDISGSELASSLGTIRPHRWYKVKVSLRGRNIRIYLDDHLLFARTDGLSQKGAVGLNFWNSDGRFRRIKVTAPDGTVLWEGPPDLP